MTVYPHPVPQDLLDLLDRHDSFWLATHERPDADGYGSLLACGLALVEAGKTVAVLDHEDTPALDALPGHDTLPRVDGADEEASAVLLFDCHRLDRLGALRKRIPARAEIAVLDHHPVGEEGCEGDVCWVIPSAAATALVVQSLVEQLPATGLSASVATCLYAALVTDTGGFRFENTRADTLLAASRLVEAGADAAKITEEFLHRRQPEALALMARVFAAVEYQSGRVALAWIPKEWLAETGVKRSDTEGIVGHLTAVAGVELVSMAIEEQPDRWRVSLRARPPRRVSEVARDFGGGGHARAAAFVAQGDRESLHPRLVDALREQLDREGGPEDEPGAAG